MATGKVRRFSTKTMRGTLFGARGTEMEFSSPVEVAMGDSVDYVFDDDVGIARITKRHIPKERGSSEYRKAS